MNLFFLSMTFLACGTKTADTSSEPSSEDTGTTTSQPEASEPSSSDTGAVEEASSEPGSEPSGEASSEDSGEEVPDDTGIDGENTSETPPTTTCMENSLTAQYGEDTVSFGGFFWELTSGDDGPKALFAGFNSGNVNVCEGLGSNDPQNYSQVLFAAQPNLSQLPHLVGIGVATTDTQVFRGNLRFTYQPTEETFYILEGESMLNSLIQGESGAISELNIGMVGEDSSDGNQSSFEEIAIQFSGGTNIVACYCEGLTDYYDALDTAR
jgi:hypothetical protein